MNSLKRLFFAYVSLFLFLFLVDAWAKYAELNFSISFIFYWMFLLTWLLAVYIWKLTSNFSLGVAFTLTLCGILFFAVGLRDVSEVFFKLGYVGWLIGVGQAIIEYVKANNKN